jgi:hypothetical protein
MIWAIIILSIIAILAFSLPIILCDDEEDNEDEELRKQLNDWQDQDNLENE